MSAGDWVVSHAGDAGDLIAALPGIAARGGAKVILYPGACTGYRMTRERAEALIPLLEAQPYVRWAAWSETPEGDVLDNWRNHYNGRLNLADMQSEYMGVPHWPRDQPWLTVPDPNRVARVVLHRSARYHGHNFPWRRVWEKYRTEAVFVGTPTEHAEFCFAAGPVPYYPTRDYLELARVLAGAEVFVGNQSSPFWVRAGLCLPLVLEVHAGCQNCHFERHRFVYGTSEHVPLPDLEPGPFDLVAPPPNAPAPHRSETSKYRHVVEPYCRGNGVDLGSAGDPVVPTAVQVELPNPYCPFLASTYPPQFRGDATRLEWFRDGVLDYVYSSHLLEDFEDWTPVLREWVRVLKPGGHLVVLLPDRERWARALAAGQPPNLAHRHEGRLGEVAEHLAGIHPFETVLDRYGDDRDFGLIYVGRKL